MVCVTVDVVFTCIQKLVIKGDGRRGVTTVTKYFNNMNYKFFYEKGLHLLFSSYSLLNSLQLILLLYSYQNLGSYISSFLIGYSYANR
jgi:hypothetical protein